MSFSNIFHIDYWFSQPYVAIGASLWVFVGGFLIMIFLGLFLRILNQFKKDKLYKTVLKRFGAFGMTMGLWGLVWLFFRQERIPFLAWRFWLLLWFLVTIWWLKNILEYLIRRMPIIKKEKAEKSRMEKYLPQK